MEDEKANMRLVLVSSSSIQLIKQAGLITSLATILDWSSVPDPYFCCINKQVWQSVYMQATILDWFSVPDLYFSCTKQAGMATSLSQSQNSR